MIEQSRARKHYQSAEARFLTPLIAAFFTRELRHYGPEISMRLAERIVEIFEAVCPSPKHLKPGQLVWNAIHKDTRADWKKRKFVPVVLTLLDEEDTRRLAEGEKVTAVRRDRMARMFEEAYEQGGLLSTRDAGLIFHMSDQHASSVRRQAESLKGHPVPHPGILHDMGSTITHKPAIIRKVVYEMQDPADVARAVHHTQRAVDHYVSSFHRVRAIYQLNPDIDFVSVATGISKAVVREYINLIEEYENESA